MIDCESIYLCTTKDPQLAALLYDIVILQAKGLSARVNFNYTKRELLGILFTESLLEIKKRKKSQMWPEHVLADAGIDSKREINDVD